MSDEELKERFLSLNRKEVETHAGAVAAFCVCNNIELEKGVEIAIDILGDQLKELLISGAYQRGKVFYRTNKKRLEKLAEMMAAAEEAADEAEQHL